MTATTEVTATSSRWLDKSAVTGITGMLRKLLGVPSVTRAAKITAWSLVTGLMISDQS